MIVAPPAEASLWIGEARRRPGRAEPGTAR